MIMHARSCHRLRGSGIHHRRTSRARAGLRLRAAQEARQAAGYAASHCNTVMPARLPFWCCRASPLWVQCTWLRLLVCLGCLMIQPETRVQVSLAEIGLRLPTSRSIEAPYAWRLSTEVTERSNP